MYIHVPTNIHVPLVLYHSGETFEGEKFHKFRDLSVEFSPWNLGHITFTYTIGLAFHESFLREFPTNPRKFSPLKVSCYSMVTQYTSYHQYTTYNYSYQVLYTIGLLGNNSQA